MLLLTGEIRIKVSNLFMCLLHPLICVSCYPGSPQPDFDDTQSMDLGDASQPALFDEPLELPEGSQRQRRLPRRFIDHMPSASCPTAFPAASLPHLLDHAQPSLSEHELESTPESSEPERIEQRAFKTPENEYGLHRVYPTKPSDNPDHCLGIEDLCDSPYLAVPERPPRQTSLPESITNVHAPFKNVSTYLLTRWQNRSVKEKTNEEMDALVQDVLLSPDFELSDLATYSSRRENMRLDGLLDEPDDLGSTKANSHWREGSVRIKLPAEDGKRRLGGELSTAEFEVKGIQYRPILETICDALDDPDAPPFHYTPYKEFWRPFDEFPKERVYGELYTGDAWLEAHEEVQRLPSDNGIENVVLPIILYSDSTHLASFGNASLWPLYMYLGAQSKYMRCKTTEPTCHHLAYIPSVRSFCQIQTMIY